MAPSMRNWGRLLSGALPALTAGEEVGGTDVAWLMRQQGAAETSESIPYAWWVWLAAQNSASFGYGTMV